MSAARILAGLGALIAILLLIAWPGALGGWRAAFLALGSVPAGAVMLLLIARVVGADWDGALLPLAGRVWLLLPAFVPLVIEQAITPLPDHLHLWLSWPLFALRGAIAIAFWWWMARLLARGRPGVLGAGLALVAHGVIDTIVGTDWLLGTSPGQPESAVAMVMAAMQLVAATGAACLLCVGSERLRRDLSFLLIAGALALPYLLFMDFLIVWYGDLPSRIGWYVTRNLAPWVVVPATALILGLFLPIAAIALIRSGRARSFAGGSALAALMMVALWQEGPGGGWAAVGVAIAALLLVTPLAWRRA